MFGPLIMPIPRTLKPLLVEYGSQCMTTRIVKLMAKSGRPRKHSVELPDEAFLPSSADSAAALVRRAVWPSVQLARCSPDMLS